MQLRFKTKEALVGYLFVAPIILTIFIFTIYPVFAGLYYSFTNYQPGEAQKFNIQFVPEDSVIFHLGVFPDEPGLNTADLEAFFDPVTFVTLDMGVRLNDEQKEAVRNHLNVGRIVQDFLAGKLPAQVSVRDFMSEYMTSRSELFRTYIPDFIGLSNYRQLIRDDYFWISLKNAFVYSMIVVPVQTFLAVLLAVAANMKIRGQRFFKIVFFVPSIASSAALSMIFLLIYSMPGILNRIISTFGFQPVDWLNNPNTALGAIMIMNIWTTAGYFMITYLAGLQNIPSSIYEASKLDGAGFWKTFWKITLPLLRPQVLFVAVLGMIGCLQVFDQIYFLIRSMRNITISFYIYKNAFEYHRMGYASAIAMVLFLIIFVITALQRKLIKEETYF